MLPVSLSNTAILHNGTDFEYATGARAIMSYHSLPHWLTLEITMP
jgi:hypothetical protein